MTRYGKTIGILWLVQSAAFVLAFFDLGSTFGGVQWLAHVGAAFGATVLVVFAILAFIVGFRLLHTHHTSRILIILIGLASVYVLAGALLGISSLQLLMPPIMPNTQFDAHIVATILAAFTVRHREP